jgi:ABC-2 type transport system permease protein
MAMAASAVSRSPRLRSPAPSRRTSPADVLVRRTFLDARVRTLAFAYIFAVYGCLQAAGYHSAYPTLADRIGFARTFAGNAAIRLFYGYPYDVVTIGGYSAWRVGGTLALAAAAFGLLAAVQALRAEEEAGRAEIVLSGVVGRRLAFTSSMVAIGISAAILWVAECLGFVIAGLPLGGSAYLALATASIVPVFVGIGAVASQLASTRRMALALSAAAAALLWLLRVVGDIVSGAAWVRWTTPLGWAEELRPFAGSRPLVVLLPLAATASMLLISARISMSRDVGSGLLPSRDTAPPSGLLLSSPTAQALRRQRGVLSVWVIGVAVFAVVLGAISSSVSAAGLSSNLQKELNRFGSGSIITPTGYLSFVFIIFIFAICLFVVSQMGAARQEEADQQLETLLAQPVSRHSWLAGRLAIAGVAAGALSGLAGLLTWAGAAAQGINVALSKMMEAGANGLPVSLMVLGLSALLYSVLPRASSPVSYALVTVLFLWYLVGSLLGAPGWLVGLTPFRHIGLVPVQSFRVEAAVVMVAIGVVAAMAALIVFRRRDLLGS